MKKLLAILGSILILTATGFAVYFLVNQSSDEVFSCRETYEIGTFFTRETSDYFNGAEFQSIINNEIEFCESYNNTSLSDCTAIEDNQKRMACYVSLVIQLDDFSNCEGDEDCELYFIFSHFSHFGSCDELPEEYQRRACLFSKTYVERDASYCYQIEDLSTMLGACDGKFSKECYYNQYKCLWGVSDHLNAVSYCEEMQESVERDVCYISLAMKNDDDSYCEGITYIQENVERCITAVDEGFPVSEQGAFQGGSDFVWWK